MSIISDHFTSRIFDREALLAYGFRETGWGLTYSEAMLEGDFEARLTYSAHGTWEGQVWDMSLGEAYLPVEEVRQTGPFVNQVRQAYLAVLDRVLTATSQRLVHGSAQAGRLVDWIGAEWADVPDSPFAKLPDFQAYRVKGKWYALFFPLDRRKLGLPETLDKTEVAVVNLKIAPENLETLLARQGIFPSYHMSKKNWVTLVLDDSLSDQEVWELIQTSKALVAGMPLGPGYWLIPANPKVYDVDAEFAASQLVDWPQKKSVQLGDWVGIYVTAPVQALRYLCQVVGQDRVQATMTLKLVRVFDDEIFSRQRLSDQGVTNIRSTRRMTTQLIESIQPYLHQD